MSTTTAPRLRYFQTEVTVDVDIDPDDLHAAGWHHKDECPAVTDPLPERQPRPRVSLMDAVDSLHRQAHPSQLPDVAVCLEEPCRSLTLDQIRGSTS